MATDVMTTKEVMAAIGVKKPDTVYKLYRDRKIAGFQLGREWRFTRHSVEALIRGESRPAPAAKPKRPPAIPGLGPVPQHLKHRRPKT
jgi:excisionase family DNA binding protein